MLTLEVQESLAPSVTRHACHARERGHPVNNQIRKLRRAVVTGSPGQAGLAMTSKESSSALLVCLVLRLIALLAKLVLDRILVLAQVRSVVGIGHGEARRQGRVEEPCAL